MVCAVQELVNDPEEYHRVAKVSNLYIDGKSGERVLRTIVKWWIQRNNKD